MQVVAKTAPGQVPVAITTAIRHLRALEDDLDLVNLYCRAALQAVEEYTGRAMLNTVYTAQLDAWPDFTENWGINSRPQRARVVDYIELPRSPLVSIASLKYYPADGGAQVTWDVGNYRADTRSLPGRLVFIDGYELPDIEVRADAVEIEFTAGVGTTEATMNALMSMAMLQLARHMFDHPGCVDEEGKVKRMPYSFRSLLRSQKISL